MHLALDKALEGLAVAFVKIVEVGLWIIAALFALILTAALMDAPAMASTDGTGIEWVKPPSQYVSGPILTFEFEGGGGTFGNAVVHHPLNDSTKVCVTFVPKDTDRPTVTNCANQVPSFNF